MKVGAATTAGVRVRTVEEFIGCVVRTSYLGAITSIARALSLLSVSLAFTSTSLFSVLPSALTHRATVLLTTALGSVIASGRALAALAALSAVAALF